MSNKEITDRFAGLLDSLPFVAPIKHEFTDTTIKVMCRISKGSEGQWAKVVEKILRTAEHSDFNAHICRLYFLHNDNMVYGWNVSLAAVSLSDALDAIARHVVQGRPKPVVKPQARLASMSAYSPPLEADVKGNPKVARQLESMPFTGMENKQDRNQPSAAGEDGRGGGLGVRKIR